MRVGYLARTNLHRPDQSVLSQTTWQIAKYYLSQLHSFAMLMLISTDIPRSYSLLPVDINWLALNSPDLSLRRISVRYSATLRLSTKMMTFDFGFSRKSSLRQTVSFVSLSFGFFSSSSCCNWPRKGMLPKNKWLSMNWGFHGIFLNMSTYLSLNLGHLPHCIYFSITNPHLCNPPNWLIYSIPNGSRNKDPLRCDWVHTKNMKIHQLGFIILVSTNWNCHQIP